MKKNDFSLSDNIASAENRIQKGIFRWRVFMWIKVFLVWTFYKVDFHYTSVESTGEVRYEFRFIRRRINMIIGLICLSPIIIPMVGIIGFYLLFRTDEDGNENREYYIEQSAGMKLKKSTAYRKFSLI